MCDTTRTLEDGIEVKLDKTLTQVFNGRKIKSIWYNTDFKYPFYQIVLEDDTYIEFASYDYEIGERLHKDNDPCNPK